MCWNPLTDYIKLTWKPAQLSCLAQKKIFHISCEVMICGQMSLPVKQSSFSEWNEKLYALFRRKEEIYFVLNTFSTIIKAFVLNKFLIFYRQNRRRTRKRSANRNQAALYSSILYLLLFSWFFSFCFKIYLNNTFWTKLQRFSLQ